MNLKNRLIIVFLIAFAPAAWSDDRIIGDVNKLEPVTGSWNPLRYQEGYVLGTISQVENRGFFFHTLEGEIKLGVSSTKGGFTDEQCVRDSMPNADPTEPPDSIARKCSIAFNPWPFSNYDEELLTNLNEVTGRLILGFFRSYAFLPLTESHRYLTKVYLVDPDRLKIGDKFDASREMEIAGVFNYAKGSVEGRIVQASMEGVIRKRYELVVQSGGGGDVFRQVSISDGRLFEFALQAMSTGRYLRIDYFELLSPLAVPLELIRGYNTYLRASRIEIINDPSGYTQPNPR